MWQADSIFHLEPDTIAGAVANSSAEPVASAASVEPVASAASVEPVATTASAGPVATASATVVRPVSKASELTFVSTSAGPVADSLATDIDTLSLRINIDLAKDSLGADTSLFYKKNFFTEAAVVPVDSVPENQGVAGIPAQSLAADNGILALLAAGFLLMIVAVGAGRRYLATRVQGFFRQRRRAEEDEPPDGTATVCLWILACGTCLAYAFVAYAFLGADNAFEAILGRYQLLALLAAGFVVFFFAKGCVQRLAGWTFFPAESVRRFGEAAFLLFACEGVLLAPAVVMIILYGASWSDVLPVFLCVFIACRLLAIYKAGQIFFAGKGNVLGFLVYLCTLEIVPFFLIWSVLASLCVRNGGLW